MNIRSVKTDDANSILEIYNWYILNTTITFETEPVTIEDMKNRINDKLSNYDWLVGEVNNKIIGYTYYGSFRPRAAYKHTVESTIYLSNENTGKGIGNELYTNLIQSAKRKGFREMLGVIALPNPASIKFHQKLGFINIGTMKNIGHKFDQYIDVAILQKSLIK